MAVTIRIPTPLRNLTKEQKTVEALGSTVGDVLHDLFHQYPELKNRICDEQGEVRRFVNLFLNDEDIRFKESKKTAVDDGDVLSIVPAIAGGN